MKKRSPIYEMIELSVGKKIMCPSEWWKSIEEEEEEEEN